MRLLIDTHILLWHLEGDERFPARRSQIISDLENDKYISIASLWEISIKISLNKLSLSYTLKELVDYIGERDIIILPISPEHTIEMSTMPFYHRDPFDRMLIAQSRVEDLFIMTDDKIFLDYKVKFV